MLAPEAVEDDFRCFYDPAHLQNEHSLESVLDRTATTRQPAYVDGLGRITGHEIVLAESVHALIDDGNNDRLPITADRQEEIRHAINRYAVDLAVSASDVVDGLIQGRNRTVLSTPDVMWAAFPPQIVMAGKVLAATAHDGQTRRSHKPYYSHVDEAASIFTSAWRQFMPATPERERELNRYLFLIYNHDGYEDTIDPFANYLSNGAIIDSPLVARHTLELYGEPDAEEYARTLFYLTRTKDTEGNRMPYLELTEDTEGNSVPDASSYVPRIIVKARKPGIATKSPDVQHNLNIEPDLIDPADEKAKAKWLKRAMYVQAQGVLIQAAEALDDPLFKWVIHAVSKTTRRQVDEVNRQKYAVDIGQVASDLRSSFQNRHATHHFQAG